MTENFNPKDYMSEVQGRPYMNVKHRIMWFRNDHPTGAIYTEVISQDPVVIKALVQDGDGKELATAHGSPKQQGVAKSRPYEGAETAAIGRALGFAGYGTQFVEDEDGVVDSPGIRPDVAPAPAKDLNLKEKLALRAEALEAEVTDKQRGMLAGMLELCFTEEEEKNRKIFMDMVWDTTSTKELTGGQVLAGLEFLRISDNMPDQKAIGTVMQIAREGL